MDILNGYFINYVSEENLTSCKSSNQQKNKNKNKNKNKTKQNKKQNKTKQNKTESLLLDDQKYKSDISSIT